MDEIPDHLHLGLGRDAERTMDRLLCPATWQQHLVPRQARPNRVDADGLEHLVVAAHRHANVTSALMHILPAALHWAARPCDGGAFEAGLEKAAKH